MYCRLVKGKIVEAPHTICELIPNPTRKQYLFFGYKPLVDRTAEGGEYIYTETETEIIMESGQTRETAERAAAI